MDFLIAKTMFFDIQHSYSCNIPGYLIVSPHEKVRNIDDLNDNARADLGNALAISVKLAKRCVSPIRTYCLLFGEEHECMHFHVFPRTRLITDEYLKETHNGNTIISGPKIFDWARTRYKADLEEVWLNSKSTIYEMKARTESANQ